ncbi:MAG: hypothetical protein VB115_14450 [Christensenellaceae bacterium]|nr:hypothetical protein [Christensenellaceae bacterium]
MSTTRAYFQNLREKVLSLSEANDWRSAVDEWSIFDVEEDETLTESCVCGKENLRYLFTICNKLNNNELYPIGSSCIKKFQRSDLNKEVDDKKQLFRLLHAIESNDYITLSPKFFSRRLLLYLYNINAFEANEYNRYEPYNDFQFMLDMFNKRMRTERQERKATAIIMNSIRPFLCEMLRNKVRR